MIAPGGALPEAAAASGGSGWLVVALAERRFAVPIDMVEGVSASPSLAPVPHAAPGLLGVGNLGGRIVPILDLAALLGRARGAARYDGDGDILRLRHDGGSVGLWVDRAERLLPAAPTGVELLDPALLLARALAHPRFGAGLPSPLGEIAGNTASPAAAPAPPSFILAEVAGEAVGLRRDGIVELIEAVPWTAVPRAPAGLLGIAVLRGDALPVLSLAALLQRRSERAGGFAAVEFDRRRVLFAVDRLVGLRSDPAESRRAPIDLPAMIAGELRGIVRGFPAVGDSTGPLRVTSDAASPYLAFAVAGQDCAIPIAAVDRVVAGRPLTRLPRPAAASAAAEGVIESRGQIIPVAALRSRLGLPDGEAAPPPSAAAYVILRDAAGLGAVAADRITGIVRLRPDEIGPPAAEEQGPIDGVALAAGGALLRILAPDRLWGAG